MNVMNDGQKACVLDTNTNMLTCVEPDGSMMQYNMAAVPSSKSLEIKKSALDELINRGKKCIDSGKCEPIKATFFSLDSCGHCKSHSSILNNVDNILNNAGIPFELTKKNAREHIDEFKKIKCNGTPCVTVNRGGEEMKLYEGNKGEIGVIADLLGLPNPLFKKGGK